MLVALGLTISLLSFLGCCFILRSYFSIFRELLLSTILSSEEFCFSVKCCFSSLNNYLSSWNALKSTSPFSFFSSFLSSNFSSSLILSTSFLFCLSLIFYIFFNVHAFLNYFSDLVWCVASFTETTIIFIIRFVLFFALPSSPLLSFCYALSIFSWRTLGSSGRALQGNNKFRWSIVVLVGCYSIRDTPFLPFASVTVLFCD